MSNIAKKNLTPEDWASKLKAYFSGFEGAIIAYSGGVDSALLAYVAHLTLGNNMLAALADSPSLSRREYRHALAFATEHDIPLQIIDTCEMQNPFYAANQGDRCYHCKKRCLKGSTNCGCSRAILSATHPGRSFTVGILMILEITVRACRLLTKPPFWRLIWN